MPRNDPGGRQTIGQRVLEARRKRTASSTASSRIAQRSSALRALGAFCASGRDQRRRLSGSFRADVTEPPGGKELFLGLVRFENLRTCAASLTVGSARAPHGFGLFGKNIRGEKVCVWMWM